MNFKLPFNWFDLAVLVVLVVGIFRGRKRGMSQEFLTCSKWIMLVLAGAVAYEPLGLWLSTVLPLSKLTCYIFAYLAAAGLVTCLFLLLQSAVRKKMDGSDAFGRSEYYMAMPAGMLRCACVLLAVLALLNARLFTQAEIKAADKYNKDVYGSNFFPTWQSTQAEVFDNSYLGPHIKKHLSFLLIKPTAAQPGKVKQARARETFL